MPFNIGPQNVVDQIKIKAQLSDLAAAFKTRLLWFLAKFFSVFFFFSVVARMWHMWHMVVTIYTNMQHSTKLLNRINI